MKDATIETRNGNLVIECGVWSLSNNSLLFCSTHHVGRLSNEELDELYVVMKARNDLKAVPERLSQTLRDWEYD